MTVPETDTPAVCGECREIQRNRAWALRAFGHPECRAAIRAEQQAARRFGIRIDPAGHIEGSTYAGQFDTTDKVHKIWTPKAADRRRETAEGWRHEILSHAEWKRRAEPCLRGECQHDDAEVDR